MSSQQIKVIRTETVDSEGIGLPDYDASLRALISVDKPATPSPYDDTSLFAQWLGIAHNTSQNTSWTASTWGTGMDFYITNLHFRILTPGWLSYGPLFSEFDQQFIVELANGITGELLFAKSWTALDKNVSGEPDDVLPNAWYVYADTWSFKRMKRVPSSDSLKLTIHNWTGYWMYAFLHVSGIPIP